MKKNRSIEHRKESKRGKNNELVTQHNEMEQWADDMFSGLGMPRLQFGNNFLALTSSLGSGMLDNDMEDIMQGMHQEFQNSFKAMEDMAEG